MFKVLLLDDEPWALFSLENSFEWEEAGFEVIAKTTDPQEALTTITNQKPDAVFTDIRMDSITGIDIMKKSRELGIESEFIIVSAYGEFSYAQDAIKYGVFHYMLKPIDMDEAQNIIIKLATHLQFKKSLIEKVADLGFLDDLLQNREEADEYFKNNGLVREYEAYQVITAKGKNIFSPDVIRFPKYSKHMDLKLGPSKYVYFINCQEDLREWFQELWTNTLQSQDISIGISSICSSLENIYQKYREADIAICREFVHQKKGVYFSGENNSKYVRKLLDEITEAIEDKSLNSIHDMMTKLPEDFIKRNLGMEDITFFYNQIAAYMSYSCNSVLPMADIDFMDYEQLCKKFANCNDLCKFLSQHIIRAISGDSSVKNLQGTNENFMKLLEHVEANYNTELYLNDLAEKFYLNVSYLSVLFKKNTDKTFTEYVTSLRMEKAKNLLANTDFTIAQISEKVGYNDYYYFSKMFKKYYEKTPKQYRNER